MPNPTLIAGRFQVIRPLGHGGFGHTYLATDVTLHRQVALKVLSHRHARDWKAYELFEREAATLRDLRHPGIPMIHEALDAEWDQTRAAVLVMEYVPGPTLAEVIAERRHLASDEVLDLFLALLDVLEYLHTRVPPVLHRDVKPANIILRPGAAPALVDFGAVRNVFLDGGEPGSTVVGTYGYMPYEQTMGQASPSSDLYALAATMLHLLTGRPPTEFMTENARLNVPEALPGGESLRAILGRMLRTNPAERFPTAREVRSALLRGTAAGTVAVALNPAVAAPVSAAPRKLAGDTRRLWRKAAYSSWDLLTTDTDPGVPPNLLDVLLLGVLSVVTVGIMPAIFVSRAMARRQRLKPFFVHGTPAVARVLDMAKEKIEFGAQLRRVRYAFEADGRRHLGSDRILPAVAERLEADSPIHILYLPDRDYDSVIVGPA
jgi:serine/threonine protein kinase